MKIKQLREMLKPLTPKVREAILRRLAIERVMSNKGVTITDLQSKNKSQLTANNKNIISTPEVILQNKSFSNFDTIWENSLPVVAETLRNKLNLSEAIDAGLNFIKETDWYINLSDKTDFDNKYRAHLQAEYKMFEKECNENNI